jgi:hypothetical protein
VPTALSHVHDDARTMALTHFHSRATVR